MGDGDHLIKLPRPYTWINIPKHKSIWTNILSFPPSFWFFLILSIIFIWLSYPYLKYFCAVSCYHDMQTLFLLKYSYTYQIPTLDHTDKTCRPHSCYNLHLFIISLPCILQCWIILPWHADLIPVTIFICFTGHMSRPSMINDWREKRLSAEKKFNFVNPTFPPASKTLPRLPISIPADTHPCQFLVIMRTNTIGSQAVLMVHAWH